ncbi:hypothetical protein ACUUL3_13230 [Thiovibrio sp. JS02]
MKSASLKTVRAISILAGLATFVFLPAAGHCTGATACSDGLAEPPFLSYGIDPNVLLMIDNSGSMYDLAYIDPDMQCYDDTYDTTGVTAYAGYFENDSWYAYNFATKKFVKQAAEPTLCATGTAGVNEEYYAQDAAANKYLCTDLITTTTPESVSGFAAKGNFLNWAATSKFDIQKQILTGGKYDSTNDVVMLESRGCTGRRFVKQVTLAQTSGGENYKIALGVRGPMEVYNSWRPDTAYVVGNIVQYGGILYKAIANFSSGTIFTADPGKWAEYKDTRWYPGHAYPAGVSVLDVASQSWFWTRAGGTSLAAATSLAGDTAITWEPFNGTEIEIFDIKVNGFDVSSCQLAIEELGTLTGEDDADENTRLGQLKSYTEDCLGYDQGSPNTEEGYKKAAFNHSMQECWYYDKFGHWQPGAGTVTSLKSSCENLYGEGVNPADISAWDSGYVCSGSYTSDPDKSDNGYVGRCWEPDAASGTLDCEITGCGGHAINTKWEEGSGSTKEFFGCRDLVENDDGDSGFDGIGELYKCTDNNLNSCNLADDSDWVLQQTCSGGGDVAVTGWTNDNFYYFNPCRYNTCTENDALISICPDLNDPLDTDWACTDGDGDVWTCQEVAGDGDNDTDSCYIADPVGDRCVDQALKDFCNIVSVPEVIDPSDATSLTGETWNAPAMLVDSGVFGQLDLPLATMRALITETTEPTGLIQEFASDLRIGVMTFNDNGAAYECASMTISPTDPIAYDCPTGNRDGGKVVARIDQSASHTDNLVDAINDIVANSWTPLAEAMYNAIGYFGQKTTRRLNPSAASTEYDFKTATEDPVNWPDPITAWCQDNHVVVITEGFSTADLNPAVEAFVVNEAGEGTADDLFSTTTPDSCGDLSYSTWLDDLTYFAYNADVADIYATPTDADGNPKQNISTHIIVAGTARVINTASTTAECSPSVLMANAATNGGTVLQQGGDAASLAGNLEQTFSAIRAGASAGSAASVISSSRGGEGAIYQAIFWPSRDPSIGDDDPIKWAGEVHALFIDTTGYLYEDTNGNRKLDLVDAGEGLDKRVIIYFDEGDNTSRACYAELNADGTCDIADRGSLDEVRFLWSTTDWLAKISLAVFYAPYGADDVYLNRESDDYISNVRRRFLFTWNDLNNDGIVDYGEDDNENASFDTGEDTNSNTVFDTEVLPLMAKNPANPALAMDWGALTYSAATRGSVINDFNPVTAGSNAEVNTLIDWLRGYDDPDTTGLRSRMIKKKIARTLVGGGEDGNGYDSDGDNVVDLLDTDISWRMGDVVHSTPIAVGRPAEALHFIYGDRTYANFAARWQKRRHMAYFGANDGMLHAVNGGFYVESMKKFCLDPTTGDDGSGNLVCTSEAGKPELGAEMWAYVPYNLLPHLKCLASEAYEHKYYVDLMPRVFDAKIFPEEDECATSKTDPACIHPDGWGTVMVGGMRFGGAPEAANTLPGALAGDTRIFTSSYFVLDITNPEAPPKVLGEMTMTSAGQTDMGYTTSSPTPVVMKDGKNYEFYLIMGSGPTSVVGESTQKPRVTVLPLEWLTGGKWEDVAGTATFTTTTRRAFRLPTAVPSAATNQGGTFVLNGSGNGFVSDLITVDFDLLQDYKSDAVYFGTVEGSFGVLPPATASWSGKLYRMVTQRMDDTDAVDDDADGYVANDEMVTEPADWHGLWPTDGTNYAPLFNAGQPIVAAPSVGSDGNNYFVYFGTGRFYDRNDKDDTSQQSYYGIKEPIDCATGRLTWGSVAKIDSDDATTDPAVAYGSRGIQDVTKILVSKANTSQATLVCTDTPLTDCLPDAGAVNTFIELQEWIAGRGCYDQDNDVATVDIPTGTDGWFRDFTLPRERNLGEATLLGGLLTFTTYQPFSDPCRQEGLAFLYGLHYQTGASYYQSVFGTTGENADGTIKTSISLGRGLATTPNIHIGSDEAGNTAFIQTSTGEIKEIGQISPLENYKTQKLGWEEVVQ